MELFNLLAKLTLDTKEFERDVSRIQGRDIDGGNVVVGLDTEEYDRGVEDVSTGSDTLGEHVGGVFDGIKTAITAAGIATVLTGIKNLIAECVNKAATMGDEIDKGSKRMGISTRTYQVWNHALSQSGGGITDLTRGMKNLRAVLADSKEITEAEKKALEELGISTEGKTRAQLKELATNAITAAESEQQHADTIKVLNSLLSDNADATGAQAEALKALGISTRGANGELKSSEKLMEETVLALADMMDTDKRDNLVDVLFGPNSGGIKPLLDEGREGVKALLDEADDLGLIMDDEEIKNAVEYGDAVANLNKELDAVKTAFVRDLMPVLTSAVGFLTNILSLLNPRLQTNSVFEIFSEIDAKALLASTKVDEANATAKKLIEDLQNLGDYWSLDEQGRMTWDALADKALELFPELSKYIEKDGKKIQGNTKDIEANIDAWSRLEKQRLLSAAMAEKEEAVAKQLVEGYEKGAAARAKEAEATGKQQVLIDQMNKKLGANTGAMASWIQKSGNAQVTENNFDTAMEFFGSAQYQSLGMQDEVKEYRKVADEAANLREEANKLIDDANKAKESLADQQKYLMAEMGYTEEEIDKASEKVDDFKRKLEAIPRRIRTDIEVGDITTPTPAKQAKGNDFVPFDNYPSLLHRGEMVLTASEARRYRDGEGNGAVDLSGLKQDIISAIQDGMADAQVNAFLDGKAVTDEVARRMAADMAARRFG